MSEHGLIENDFAEILGGPTVTEKMRTQSSNAPKDVQNATDLVTESELADFWQVSSRQVRKLLSDAVIKKVDGKRFSKAAATRGYLRHLVASARVRGGNDPELRAEKLRLAKEQADHLELKNAEKRRQLVPAKQVESEWSDILRTVRSGLLAVPGRVGARLALSQTHLSEIDIEIRAVLKELGE
jgi:phage terminase Nu1 subunit (DNA packaging protein)